MPYRHKNTPKYDTLEERDRHWIIKTVYIKLILKYSKNIGGTTDSGVKITQEFLDVLRTRYNQLKPKNPMDI